MDGVCTSPVPGCVYCRIEASLPEHPPQWEQMETRKICKNPLRQICCCVPPPLTPLIDSLKHREPPALNDIASRAVTCSLDSTLPHRSTSHTDQTLYPCDENDVLLGSPLSHRSTLHLYSRQSILFGHTTAVAVQLCLSPTLVHGCPLPRGVWCAISYFLIPALGPTFQHCDNA